MKRKELQEHEKHIQKAADSAHPITTHYPGRICQLYYVRILLPKGYIPDKLAMWDLDNCKLIVLDDSKDHEKHIQEAADSAHPITTHYTGRICVLFVLWVFIEIFIPRVSRQLQIDCP